jgi:hypothetical protein
MKSTENRSEKFLCAYKIETVTLRKWQAQSGCHFVLATYPNAQFRLFQGKLSEIVCSSARKSVIV